MATEYPEAGPARKNWAKHGERPSLKDWDAKGDTQVFTAKTVSASANVESVFTAATGTITSAGTAVTGTGTNFLIQIEVGQFIFAGGKYAKVQQVISDTELVTFTGFTPPVTAQAFTVGRGFEQSDIDKRIVIYGAGNPATDRETFLVGSPVGVGTTNAYAEATRIDVQGGSRIGVAVNCATANVDWELYGSNSSSFSPETLVHGPSTVAALAASDSYSSSSLGFRYYRTKVKSSVLNTPATAYVTMVAWGYVLGSSITAVIAPNQCTIADTPTTSRDSAYAYFGTDDTEAIQKAFDAATSLIPPGTADGGTTLEAPMGKYLFSSPITHQYAVSLKGHSGGGAIFMADGAAFPTDTAMWNMTGVFPTEQRISFFTRFQDARIDCGHVPGSIGIFCDSLQENSGIYRATVIQWNKYGVQACTDTDRYGCINWIIQDPWIYPSLSTFLDDTVAAFKSDYALYTTAIRGTYIGQSGFICGYGKCMDVGHGTLVTVGQIHMESARIGIHFNVGASGIMGGCSAQPFVQTTIKIEGGNPVTLFSISTAGKNTVDFPYQNVIIQDPFVPCFYASNLNQPQLFSSPIQMVSDPAGGPNIITWNPVNFALEDQGGWRSVNSMDRGYPNWVKTSTSVFDSAMFIREATTQFELRMGPANQPVNVAHGICDVSGTSVAWVSGDLFDTGWPAGTQIVINGTLTTIASVGSTISLTVNLNLGNLTAVGFGVSTDPEGLGGTNPGLPWFNVLKGRGMWSPRIYFDNDISPILGPSEFGNNIDTTRFRWMQFGSVQRFLVLQMSTDSGSTWADIFTIDAVDDSIYIPQLYFDDAAPPDKKPLRWGNNLGSYRARWTQGTAGQQLLSLERSIDSGGSWEKFIYFDLSGILSVNGKVTIGPESQNVVGDGYTLEVIDASATGVTTVVVRGGPLQVVGSTETPAFTVKTNSGVTGVDLYGSGRADVKRLGVGAAAPTGAGTTDGFATVNDFLGIATAVKSADSEIFRVNGGALFDGFLKMSTLTASRPVVTDANKKFVSSKIDLGSANFVQGTGLSAGDILEWDGTKVIGTGGGVNVNLTEITSGPTSDTFVKTVALSGVVPPGLTLTVTTATALTGFGVATHATTNGIVTS